MKASVKAKDMVKGYKLDFANNNLIVNHKFSKAMSVYGSPEYKRYKAILRDFPDLTVVEKAGREIKTTRKTKRLTYKNMETYISCQDNAEERLIEFDRVRRESQPEASPYKYVRDWFEATFPDYKNATIFVQPEKNKEAAHASPAPIALASSESGEKKAS